MLEFYKKNFMSDIKLINQLAAILWCTMAIVCTVSLFYDWVRSLTLFLYFAFFWINATLTIICMIKYQNEKD